MYRSQPVLWQSYWLRSGSWTQQDLQLKVRWWRSVRKRWHEEITSEKGGTMVRRGTITSTTLFSSVLAQVKKLCIRWASRWNQWMTACLIHLWRSSIIHSAIQSSVHGNWTSFSTHNSFQDNKDAASLPDWGNIHPQVKKNIHYEYLVSKSSYQLFMKSTLNGLTHKSCYRLNHTNSTCCVMVAIGWVRVDNNSKVSL